MEYQIQIVAQMVDDRPSVIIDNRIEDKQDAIEALLSLSSAINKRVKEYVLSSMLNSIIDDLPSEQAKELRLKILQNPKARELLMESLWNFLKVQLS